MIYCRILQNSFLYLKIKKIIAVSSFDWLKNQYLLQTQCINEEKLQNENGMAVDDRIAFACMFLPDKQLHAFLKKLSEKLTEEGNLDGLLLTGTEIKMLKC